VWLTFQGLERWEGSGLPYTSHALPVPGYTLSSGAYAASPFMSCIAAARRGIIIVGQMTCAEDAAAALKIAEALGWPLVADVLSGIDTDSRDPSKAHRLVLFMLLLIITAQPMGCACMTCVHSLHGGLACVTADVEVGRNRPVRLGL